MKNITYLILIIVGFAMQNCTQEKDWSQDYDIKFPVPVISSVSNLRVNVNDTLTITGKFDKIVSVKIGEGDAEILSFSTDSTTMKVLVKNTCSSGPLKISNIYKNFGTYTSDIVVEGGGVVIIPEEVVILDFTAGGALPTWTKNTWAEAKDFAQTGFDINKINPPVGYEHYFAMNDTLLADDGNTAYGNYTSDNNGAGFDISFYSNPYVSVLINTGNDCAYLSLVLNGVIKDFQPANSPGGIFANGEKEHHMQTNGKWMWYTFSLAEVMGGTVPTPIKSAGLFIRAGWDYPAAIVYPGFQLNIAKMVITEGPLPKKIVLFDFESGEPSITTAVTSWASDKMTSWGIDGVALATIPEGKHYFSMINHHNGNWKNYTMALKADNNGNGYDFSKMKDPYITFAVNTGNYSGYLDFVFYQADSGNKEGEPWVDPGRNNSALNVYPELIAKPGIVGYYFDTKGLWEYRTYNVKKLIDSIDAWARQDGKYPNYNAIFDYILIWPRDGWDNDFSSARYELSIDNVIITDGIPTGLPALNK